MPLKLKSNWTLQEVTYTVCESILKLKFYQSLMEEDYLIFYIEGVILYLSAFIYIREMKYARRKGY